MKITLETATFVDSLRKAEAIAPKKGEFADTTYGIILETDHDAGTLVLKATDGVFFYMESVPVLDIEGEGKTVWRVPSAIFYGSVSKLPTRMGSQVTIENDGTAALVKSGKTVIKIQMLANENFPEFEFYDASEFHEFTNITGKSNKLKWATSSLREDPKHCILVRNEYMYATNSYQIGRIKLEADSKITALYPPLTLSRVVPFGADVQVAQKDSLLVISPDPYSQLLMATMSPEEFPADQIDAMMKKEYQYKSTFSKSEMVRMLDGVSPLLDKGLEGQVIQFWIGSSEVAIFYASEAGSFGDKIPCFGDSETHKRIRFYMSHGYLKSAMDSLPEIVTLHYTPEVKSFKFTDDNYESLIALRSGDRK